MNFLLQKDVFTEDETQDTEAIIRKHFENVQVIPDDQIFNRDAPLPKNFGGPFRGTLALATRLGKKFPWADALKWAPYFRTHLASENYEFLDAASILIRGIPDRKFIRPTSGNKDFSGNVFTQESFQKEINFLVKNKNGDPHIICLTAEPAEILLEWRLIFVNNNYSSGSQYMEKGEKVLSPKVPEDVISFGKKIADNAYFQNIFDFVIDIGQIGGELRLIEINGFETASFYDADLEKVYSDWAAALK